MRLPVSLKYQSEICLSVNPTMNADIIVPIPTAPNMFEYHKAHITKAIATIEASNPILIVENLHPVTMAMASTHPSPGRGGDICRQIYEDSESY